jgi:hypothetical protein
MCGSAASAAETIVPNEQSQTTSPGEAQEETELKVVLAQTPTESDDSAISTVPEPTTWIMLTLGLLGVGFAMRRPASESAVRVRYL